MCTFVCLRFFFKHGYYFQTRILFLRFNVALNTNLALNLSS